jgi:Winged helix-turn-helix DNA-binding
MEFCQAEARRHRQDSDDIRSEVYARMWAILELPPVDQEEGDRWRTQVTRIAAGLRKREQRAHRKGAPSKPVAWERSASAVDQPEFAAEFNEGIAAIRSDAGLIDSLVLDYLLGKQPSAKQSDIARELGISPKTVSKHKVQLEKRLLSFTGASTHAH